LEQDRRFRDPAVRDSQTESLAFEIRRRAAGVFLWVHLVVWELLRGLSEEDEIDMLQTRLDMLPKSLEEFFAHIVKSMEQVCRKYTARSLMLAHRAREPLPVMAYAFLYDDTRNAAFLGNVEVVPLTWRRPICSYSYSITQVRSLSQK
jgi:hypothetical protein